MEILPPKINIKVYNLLKDFILNGGKIELESRQEQLEDIHQKQIYMIHIDNY